MSWILQLFLAILAAGGAFALVLLLCGLVVILIEKIIDEVF